VWPLFHLSLRVVFSDLSMHRYHVSKQHTSDFERGRVIAYRDSGLTYREIEEKTAVKQTRLWDEWLELGKSTYSLPSGRPFMHEPKRRRGILATIETNRLTSFESLASQEGCSRSTIRKIAAEDGLQRHLMRHAPPITDCTRVKRLQWVEDNMQRDWRTVLWTDEVPLTWKGSNTSLGHTQS